ncbi:MAG: peptidoglycan bridge formation glycyltransferase FemA/FemB family protein [Eubacterium sp.]|nr:peptidoglycan bridge formation glycyltransferase FemA/FemB family protein [Eubacterium sp.]
MYKILDLKDEKQTKDFKEFLEGHPRCNFQQSLEWGNVKTFWIKEVVVSCSDDGKIRGSLTIWVRKMPIFGYMMYVARGPVCDIHDKAVLKDLKDGSDEIAKKYKAFVLRMEPDVEKEDKEYRKIVEELGYKVKDDSKDFKDEIQPRFVFQLDLRGKDKDTIFSEFHQKTRYNTRLATKKGVEVKEGTRDDLKIFHNIMIETGKRDDFLARPLSYFEKMYDELVPGGHMKLLMAYHEGQPISGIIPIMYGNKTWYLYGASSNSKRNVMPNYLLQWTSIQEAIDAGHEMYDFRGVSGVVDENHPQYGLYRFKKGFNARFVEFIGEVYLPYKPFVYKMYKFAEKTFRTIRGIKSRLNQKV